MDETVAGHDPASCNVPEFAVNLAPPGLGEWRTGNTGVPGFWRFAAAEPGPEVGITALVHGNEIAGAWALLRLLEDRVRPRRGALTLGFVNLAAFDRFDPAQPTLARFVDEDFNRLWDPAVLEAGRPSVELLRAQDIRPLIDRLDVLLDLHSMLWPSETLMLCPRTRRGLDLARAMGVPGLVVADDGHASGRRLIDYPRFAAPGAAAAALLVEAGPHWEPATVDAMLATVEALLTATGLAGSGRTGAEPRIAEVTDAVVAQTARFAFARPYRGGTVVERAASLIARDGETEIRTPYDGCLLVMPSLRPSRGHTAVRLARFIDAAAARDWR